MQFKNLKVGEVLSETQFYKVEKVVGSQVQLKTDSGESIIVDNKYVDDLLNSGVQFTKTEKITRTELVEKFLTNARVAMTVNFNKQVKPEDIKQQLVALYPNKGGKLMSEAEFKKAVAKAIDLKGDERTMIGRHYGVQDSNGRVHFIDMQIDKDPSKAYDARQRLVDPRTINYVVVSGVKYEVK